MNENNEGGHTPAGHMIESLMMLAQQFEPIAAAATGYRKNLEREGWTPEAAENMAIQYHALIVTAVEQAILRGTDGL